MKIQRSFPTYALVLLCLGLGTGVYYQLTLPGDASLVAPAGEATTRSAATRGVFDARPEFRIEQISAFAEMVQRPLFNPTRRPDQTPAVATVKMTKELPTLNVFLSGIVMADDKKLVHLRSASNPRVMVLSEGEEIDSWRVDRILPDRVILRLGSRSQEVLLKEPDRRFVAKNRRRSSIKNSNLNNRRSRRAKAVRRNPGR